MVMRSGGNLILMSLFLFSCRTVTKDDRRTEGISLTEETEGDVKLHRLVIHSKDPKGYSLAICKNEEETCSTELTTESSTLLKGLKPGNYIVNVFGCSQLDDSGSCSAFVGRARLTQEAYPNESSELYLTNERDINNRQTFVASVLLAMFREHKENLEQCVKDQGLSRSDLTGSFHGKYLDILDVFLAHEDVEIIQALSSIYADEAPSDLLQTLESFPSEGLGLAGFQYTAERNVRVTLVKFATPPPRNCRSSNQEHGL